MEDEQFGPLCKPITYSKFMMSLLIRNLQEDANTFECSKPAHWHYICVISDGPIEMPIFLGGSDGKESSHNSGDPGLIPELGRSPGGGHGNPLQYSCLENPHGQRSLAGYSPGGHKGLDMAEVT